MKNASSEDRKTIRHPLLLLGGAALVVLGIGAAGWVIQTRGANGSTRASGTDDSLPQANLPAVVAIGTVDVEGGVVALLPLRPGRVAEVSVHENEVVRKGAVLLRLEDQLARFEVQEAEAAVQAAEAQMANARNAPREQQLLLEQQRAALLGVQHELVAARLLAARRDKLVGERLLSKEEADADAERTKKLEAVESAERAKLATLELHDPEQDLVRARANLLAKQALLGKARYALHEHQLVAPLDGSILRVFANPGELVGPQAKQPAFLFCPAKPRIVRAELEQEFAGRVSVGQRAVIRDDVNTAGPSWNGRVIRISGWFAPRRTVLPDTLPIQEIRTLECIVQFDSGETQLRVGQRVRVTLLTDVQGE
jgi:multidrug resistance efflux pump